MRYPQFAGSNHGITVPNQTSDGEHAVDLTWRPAVNKEAAGLLRGDDLGIGEFVPALVAGGLAAHFLPTLMAGGAAPFSEMAAAEAALAEGALAGGASAGGTAGGLESLVGPATGAVESAPVINLGGPTVSAVASGAGPFIPTIPGIPGLSQALSSVLDNASGGGTAATSLANALTQPTGASGIPDWLLKLLPAGIGAYASSQQADAIRQIAERSRADREPFRQKALGYLNDPNSYATGPGAATLDAVLRRLSVGGNPIGDPAKLGIATSAGLQDWRNTVLGLGNLGLAGEDTRASLDLNAVKADKGVWDSLGAGVADVVKPQKSLEDILKSMGGMKLSIT